MSGARFGDVDLDLLADYVGGALDGTPDADAVAGRVAADPAWTRAHEELTAALAAVRDDLSSLAAAAEPMPADVAARIDAALSALSTEPTLSAEPAAGEVGRPRLSVVKGEGHAGAATRPGPARRWARWAGGSAAAAALVALAGLGVNALILGGADDTATSGSADSGAPAMAPYAAEDGSGSGSESLAPGRDKAGAWQVVASGTNYRRGNLPAAAFAQAGPRRSAAGVPGTGGPGQPAPSQPPGELLAAPPPGTPEGLLGVAQPLTLNECLAAILRASGRPGAAVQVVDLATFEGRPAVVVVLAGADGRRIAWVAGPDCGTPAAGADTMYTSAVR